MVDIDLIIIFIERQYATSFSLIFLLLYKFHFGNILFQSQYIHTGNILDDMKLRILD